jgi:hypothetical protein
MRRNLALAGAAATGAVGYAMGCWLARTTEYATRLESDQLRRRPVLHRPPAGPVAGP